MNNVSFYGKNGETTGSVGEKSPESSRAETTGSIGYYSFGEEGTPNIKRSLSRDAVSFQRYDGYNQKNGLSTAGVVFGVTSLAALAIVGCGYAQKTNVVNKITNENVKRVVTSITEPCYKLCSNIKTKGTEFYKKAFKK